MEVINLKTYKIKLYNSKKNKRLQYLLFIANQIYNHSIALHRRYWKLFHKTLNKYKLQKHLAKIKKLTKYSYWKKLPSHAIQNITDRIDNSYKLFWENLKKKRKTSPPKFKKLRKYRSFSYNMVGKRIIKDNTIKIAGNKYKFFKSREIEGKILLLTVKKDLCGDFYVYLVCDTPIAKIKFRLGKSIGFDFGFKGKMLIAPQKADDISAPFFLKKQQNAISRANRHLSSKHFNSHNRQKAYLKLARLHRKIFNQRRAYHWQLARKLCQEYSVICFESLNMKYLQKRHGKKIADYGFSNFLSIIKYLAPQFGTKIIQVDKFYPSSQLCHNCGYQNATLKDLKIRKWICPQCGEHHDRDRNAAKNILTEGLHLLHES